MLGNLSGWHLVVIVFIVLLLFGAPKLPGLARSLGQSMKIFKSEIKSDKTDERATTDVAQPNQSDASQSTGSTDSTTKS